MCVLTILPWSRRSTGLGSGDTWTPPPERRENLFGLENVQRVIQDLHPFDRAVLVQDEVGPLPVSVHRALLVGDDRAVSWKHLTAEVGEEQMLDIVGRRKGDGGVLNVCAPAHDLGARGFEAGTARLEAGDLPSFRRPRRPG